VLISLGVIPEIVMEVKYDRKFNWKRPTTSAQIMFLLALIVRAFMYYWKINVAMTGLGDPSSSRRNPKIASGHENSI